MTATRAERRAAGAAIEGAPGVERVRLHIHIVERSLRDRRRSLTSWGIGIACYLGLIVAFWPSIRGSSEIADAIENYPDAMKEFFGGAAAFDYTRPGGFLNTQLFSLMAPLLLGAFAMGYGASTIAGEERTGQLDLVLALPVRRARIVGEKAAAVALGVAALTVLSIVVVVGVGAAVDLDVPVVNVVAACIGSGLVALVHGGLALMIGAATGNRAVALGTSSAVFAAGYLLQALSGLVDALKPLRVLSPLHHANGTVPINNGFPVWHHLLLAVLFLGVTALAVGLFERRDLRL
jgi:ABC-2 type transport system permease protein